MTVFRNILTPLLALAALSSAHPLHKRTPCPLGSETLHAAHSKRQESGGLSDLDILQFALTLEHLEATFYKDGFAKFPASDFMALGVTPEQLSGLIAIGETEATHVTALSDTITAAGGTSVQPCTYDFKFTDAAGMLATAKILEAVGVSAYLGAAPLVQDPKVLGAAGSIVTVEGRHQTLIRTVLRQDAIPQAFDAAIGARQIFTLAAGFITGCPAGSELPITGFPSLNILGAAGVTAGSKLRMDVGAAAAVTGPMFCSFTSGEMGTVFAPFEGGACTVPEGLGGEVYVTISSDGTELADDKIVAGPAVLSLS